ncbi:hypothetical protein C8C94_4868 [Acidovorax sp. 94]|jgi:hypothetical protein|uniref:hypothetical protein n=1 Tax=unclassified Acidovorax TaxID=2684926 RepID=UPI000EADFC1D|nr:MULTISPECIES: hypothetical protein [unclassified Acidovorax]MBV7458789.1 hypothetical protein [Acidovorax sp. sif0632]MBV7463389.1 hypothetical protein [Acidovorax sp. sif0613]RKR70321.1 hypothetical protein C8C94_4868 [Acidovorax sp. 94]
MAENIGLLPYAVQSELAAIRDVIGLVAFAVEARRVLQAVDVAADGIPHIGKALSGVIDMRRQWTEFPDTAAAVLASMHWRLEELLMVGE